jgi:RNA polymerase sigma-70 factor (ECF subfamily)
VSPLLSAEEQSSLVSRLQAGNEAAATEFVHMFEGRLRTMIAQRLRDRELARDLTQEALLAALNAVRGGGLREPERLAAFVYGVGRNVVNNHLRRRQNAPAEVPLEPDALASASPADTIEEDEQRRLAERAVGSLPRQDRDILTLTLVDGLKPGAIAERLQLSVDVVRARKSRALKKVIVEVQRLSRFKVVGH